MPDLKSCPFCNGEADLVEIRMTLQSLWEVTCIGDDCEVSPSTGYNEDMQEAIDAWNKRAPQAMTMGG